MANHVPKTLYRTEENGLLKTDYGTTNRIMVNIK